MATTAWIRGAVIAAIVALIAGAVTVILSTRTEPVQADDDVSIEGLTGKALGEELGLEPVPYSEVKGECWAFAEYEDGNGFCMDSVVSSKVEAALLGRQINGHLVSPAQREFIELSQELANLEDSGEGTPEEIEKLRTRLWEMQKSLNVGP